MRFRYTASWFYWPVWLASTCVIIYVGGGCAVLAARALEPILPASREIVLAVVLPFGVGASLVVIWLGLFLHERLHWLYPAHPIAIDEKGITFDLPLGIGGFVDWRDVESVTGPYSGAGTPAWYVRIQFKQKRLIGPAGLEKDLERLLIGGHRLLPSGRAFLEAAKRLHAKASGGSAAAGPSEERHPILRWLAWTFRRPPR